MHKNLTCQKRDEFMKKIKTAKKISMITIFMILIIILLAYLNSEKINQEQDDKKQDIVSENSNTQKSSNTAKFIYSQNSNVKSTVVKKEYENMPSQIKDYKVIGKLEIPSINLETYILEETNEKTLNISVTKLAGPEINQIGNFCITGHNYINSKMFYKLGKVSLNDEIILTDTYDDSVNYKVYETKEIEPTQTDVLNQDTGGEREVTLITCTFGAKKRIVVKAVEQYD